MAVVELAEVKQYLRVDSNVEDGLIGSLIQTAENLVRDVLRQNDDEFITNDAKDIKLAVMFTIAYLYEHREEADHKLLTLTLRSLLFGVRKAGF